MNITKKNNDPIKTKKQDFLQPEPVQVEEAELLLIAGGRGCPKLTSHGSCTV